MSTDRINIEKAHETHSAELLRYLLKLLRDESIARDVLQTVFVKLMEKGGSVQQDRIRPWLYRVATNEARLVMRKRALVLRTAPKIGVQDQSNDDPLGKIETREQIELILSEAKRLPTNQQIVLSKRLVAGLTFSEISDELNIPLGTVLTRMRQALATLRQKIEEHSPLDE